MKAARRFAVSLCLVIAVGPSSVSAQARGAHTYLVQGFYSGEEGPSWDARTEVRDTLLDGKAALLMAYRSNTVGVVQLYNSVAVWTPDMRIIRSSWTGEGSHPGACRVDVEGGTGTLVIDGGRASAVTMGERPVPEFAMATAIAATPALRDGDTIRFHGYRCTWSPEAPAAMTFFDFAGTVASDTMKRAGAPSPEAVWVVTGSAAYPYRTWIAKSDRVVLKVVVPQGTVGEMIETYTGPVSR